MFTTRQTCRICRGTNLKPFAHLGDSPLADAFVTDTKIKEFKAPLDVRICTDCWLLQQITEVDRTQLFPDDYGFFTNGSPAAVKHFANYAKNVSSQFEVQPNALVVDIASNDGTLLKHFRSLGHTNILGVEPTLNTAESARLDGIPTIVDFWGNKSAKKIERNYGKATLITANNVMAHVPDLHDFVEGIKTMLDHKGVFVAEFHNAMNLVFRNQYDNIYHEHLSFFSLLAIQELFVKHDLQIFHAEEVDTQGGSYRIFVSHPGMHDITLDFKRLLGFEVLSGMQTTVAYDGYMARLMWLRTSLLDTLDNMDQYSWLVAGYGASAKSTTLLNWCGIDKKRIPYIVDKTPSKYGKYTPGTHIPIIDQDIAEVPNAYLLLVWNYANAIMQREAEFLANRGRLILPLPHVQVYYHG